MFCQKNITRHDTIREQIANCRRVMRNAMNGTLWIAALMVLSCAVANAAEELHYAANNGDLAKAKALLAKGADPNAKDKYGARPLHIAAWKGHLAIVNVLLAANADPNAKDNSGKTPLHWAVAQSKQDVAVLLREHGAK